MPAKKFQRTIEDFTCGHCGNDVTGNGYTNHCPKCLWSRHVDRNPGDRLESCEGMMKPLGIEIQKGKYVIAHQCRKCGYEKKNKTNKHDNLDKIIHLSSSSPIHTRASADRPSL